MRDLFHVPENYFLSHSVGCLPARTEEVLQSQFIAPWKTGQTWAEWMGVLDEFRHGMAGILGVDSNSICPQTNVSSALTKVIYSFPVQEDRNVILCSKQDFPTIGFVLKQAEKTGYQLRFVQGDPTDIANWKACLDATVAFVHITHALSNTSHILPVEDICERAKAVGALSIVDIAQSTGAVKVSPEAWGADFAIGTGVKFLCFGPGACFLYVSPDVLPRCEPLDVGWFSHENPFEMDIDSFRYAEDAMRFFGGTPSPAPLAMANSALKLWNDIGLEKAQAKIQAHLTTLCEGVDDSIIVSPTGNAARGGTFVIDPSNREVLRNALKAHHIMHDERKEGFRFSVHGYNLDAEVRGLVGILSGES